MTSRQRKKDKSGYGASWKETPFEKLDLPFTIESLEKVLAYGTDEHLPCSHQQIANWCYRFWLKFLDEDVEDTNLAKAIEISEDVEAQWDLYLSNTYSLTELQALDFSQVALPKEWFKEWLQKL